jgi:hypothetical protein
MSIFPLPNSGERVRVRGDKKELSLLIPCSLLQGGSLVINVALKLKFVFRK